MNDKELIKELERLKKLLYPFYSMSQIMAVNKIDKIINKINSQNKTK